VSDGALRLGPARDGTDGFYLALFERAPEPEAGANGPGAA
jgi:hypothetical protein